MGALFGTDGIRGEANHYPMDAMTAFTLGQALTHVIHPLHRPPVVVIGKDTRISGYMLESALEAGITSMGGIVHMLGVLPTPGIAYITQSMRADAGFVVSASHNPYTDNGIKVFGSNGFKLSDTQETEIERLMLSGELAALTPPAADMGRAYRLDDVLGRYIVFLKNSFPRSLRLDGIKIAMDVANGAAYRVAPAVYRELGADVHVINDDPNGFNINANAGAMHPEVLADVVRHIGAQIGFAYDGDADRMIAIDETGQVVSGDQILLINALELKRQGRLTNNAVVSTVMSNLGFRVACEEHDISNYAAQVGDRYVLELMKEVGAVIGGEDSGHTIFLRRHTTGDGILSSLQLITCMLKSEQSLGQLKQAMQVYPQTLINVAVTSKPDLASVPEVMAAVSATERKLGSHGRVLVRYSGTQNLCRVMVEGPTLSETESHAATIADAIRSTIAK
ncbi:MAG: phosphoglucosamine mutase [Propionibacteriaceae bacterium]|jgi:phosphoglucosamine mutase|nr:phosphoglucosamine mutase [Propionibacteriaceae bacterium]